MTTAPASHAMTIPSSTVACNTNSRTIGAPQPVNNLIGNYRLGVKCGPRDRVDCESYWPCC